MKCKAIFFAIFMIAVTFMHAQTVTLTFTGHDEGNRYVKIDSVVIYNHTEGWQETLFWPDTMLIMQVGTGIVDYGETNALSTIHLSQNAPNPFNCNTFVNLILAEQGSVLLEVTDIAGHVVSFNKFPTLQQGVHQLRLSLSTSGMYFLTAKMNDNVSAVKMINQGEGGADRIEYQGMIEYLKTSSSQKSAPKGSSVNPFHLGNQMEYVGFVTINGTIVESAHITQTQNESQTVSLPFILPPAYYDGQPCLDAPTMTDFDGNVYNTVQIGGQCWMKENLRTTHYADGTMCTYYDYDSSSLSLPERGYLYKWNTVMHGAFSSQTNPSGVQGICPDGWHLPSMAEWNQLIEYVSSQNEYQCNNQPDKIAKSLSSSIGWNNSITTCAVGNNPSENNATGFSAFPAGDFFTGGYNASGFETNFWTATGDGYYYTACYLSISSDNGHVNLNNNLNPDVGSSIRCLRDGGKHPPIVVTVINSFSVTTATVGGTVINDGGSSVIDRGVCWSTMQNPTISDNYTTDGNGMGLFTSSLTGLQPNTTYFVRAYAINSTGIGYGETMRFITKSDTTVDWQQCTAEPFVTDYDGNVYNTVQIGSQCWTKENLRCTHYDNGLAINQGNIYSDSIKCYYYPGQLVEYGYLYNWAAVKGPNTNTNNQGICPSGWHVPSNNEWTQLTQYLENQSQYLCNNNNINKAKSLASAIDWINSTTPCAVGNNLSENNATGFSALPAGSVGITGYGYFGERACFWSSTENNSTTANYRSIDYNYTYVNNGMAVKRQGFSVRCLRD